MATGGHRRSIYSSSNSIYVMHQVMSIYLLRRAWASHPADLIAFRSAALSSLLFVVMHIPYSSSDDRILFFFCFFLSHPRHQDHIIVVIIIPLLKTPPADDESYKAHKAVYTLSSTAVALLQYYTLLVGIITCKDCSNYIGINNHYIVVILTWMLLYSVSRFVQVTGYMFLSV